MVPNLQKRVLARLLFAQFTFRFARFSGTNRPAKKFDLFVAVERSLQSSISMT